MGAWRLARLLVRCLPLGCGLACDKWTALDLGGSRQLTCTRRGASLHHLRHTVSVSARQHQVGMCDNGDLNSEPRRHSRRHAKLLPRPPTPVASPMAGSPAARAAAAAAKANAAANAYRVAAAALARAGAKWW